MIECFNPNEKYHIPHCTYTFLWLPDSPPSYLILEFRIVGADDDKKFTVVLPRHIQGIIYT